MLGAGIMGGGIAYQSAWKGVPVVMKDINDKSLTLGMTEAAKLLNKQLERGKIDGSGWPALFPLYSQPWITPALNALTLWSKPSLRTQK